MRRAPPRRRNTRELAQIRHSREARTQFLGPTRSEDALPNAASRPCDAISNAKESILTSSDRKPALDLELIEVLKNDAPLLAIADATAATQAPARDSADAVCLPRVNRRTTGTAITSAMRSSVKPR
jgi:hypothetical protein